jgi:hypothetical protein
MPWKHMVGMGTQLHSFLTLALDGGKDQYDTGHRAPCKN